MFHPQVKIEKHITDEDSISVTQSCLHVHKLAFVSQNMLVSCICLYVNLFDQEKTKNTNFSVCVTVFII